MEERGYWADYFAVSLFIRVDEVVLTFKSVNENL